MKLSSSLKAFLLLSAAVLVSAQAVHAQSETKSIPAGAVSSAPLDTLDPSQPAHEAKAIEEGDGGIAPKPEPRTVKDSARLTSQQTYMQPAAEALTPVQSSVTAVKTSSNQPLLDALRTAYINNPTLRAARAELRAAAEILPQAQSNWLPSADASGTITTADIDPTTTGDGTTSKNLGLTVTQPLYRGGRTTSSISSAEHRIMAQGAILNATEQQILLNVATAYMDVVRDKALVDLSQNNIDVVGRQLDASRNRFEVGEVTRTDVAQSEARLARAQANLTSARGNLKTSLATYEQLVGTSSDSLSQTSINFTFPKSLDEAISLGETNNPNVVALNYLHQSSEKDIGTVFGELLPELGLSAGASKTWDPQPGGQRDTTSRTLSLVASVPLYEGGYTRSRVRQAKYTANQRYIQILEAKREARQNVISNWETWLASKAEIQSRQSQVEANRIAQEGVRQEADLGTRTILDSLDADQEYLDAQVALVTSQRDEIVASFNLARSLGILTPQTLGFPELAYDATKDWERADWHVLGMGVDRVE